MKTLFQKLRLNMTDKQEEKAPEPVLSPEELAEKAALKYASDLSDITRQLGYAKTALAEVIKADTKEPKPYTSYSFYSDDGGWYVEARTLHNAGISLEEIYDFLRKKIEAREAVLKDALKAQVEGCKLV